MYRTRRIGVRLFDRELFDSERGQFLRDRLNLFGRDLFRVIGQPDQQRQIAQAIDLTGNATRELKQRLKGVGSK